MLRNTMKSLLFPLLITVVMILGLLLLIKFYGASEVENVMVFLIPALFIGTSVNNGLDLN